MPTPELWAGALSLLLRHHLTGCTLTAHQAATVLERLADCPEVDAETRSLCDEASSRLATSTTEAAPCRRPN